MLYHLSKNKKSMSLTPRVPDNFFTKNGFEDAVTPRVCFAPSIDQALMALSYNLKDEIFYIHTPEKDLSEYKVVSNSVVSNKVPDAKLTGETWILNKVKTKVIGCIKVLNAKDDVYEFNYGKHKAELYKWNFKKLNNKEILESECILIKRR